MDAIVPSLHVNERRPADWDGADRMEAMGEVFRLTVGVPLNAGERILCRG